MIFINDKQISLADIKAHTGEDKVMNMLRRNLSYIEQRMRVANDDFTQSISLIWTPGKRKYNNKSKLHEGKKMVGMLLHHTISTPQGTKTVRWCENAIPGPNGTVKYSPVRRKFKKVRIYTWDHVEELLWLITFSPNIRLEMEDGEIFNANAPITVENIGLAQRRLAQVNKRKNTLGAYIHTDLSPLSPELLRTLAAAWGVSKATNPETSLEQVRNQFESKVMIAENKRDARYNIDAFMEAVKENNQFIQTQVMINRALDHKIVEWDVRGLRWIYIDDANQDVTEICRVPVAEKSRRRDYLADFLIRNRKEFIRFSESVEYADTQKEERITGKSMEESKGVSVTETEAQMEDRLREGIRMELEEEMAKEAAKLKAELKTGGATEGATKGPRYGPDTDFSKLTHTERLAAGKELKVKVAGKPKAGVIAALTEAAKKASA